MCKQSMPPFVSPLPQEAVFTKAYAVGANLKGECGSDAKSDATAVLQRTASALAAYFLNSPALIPPQLNTCRRRPDQRGGGPHDL